MSDCFGERKLLFLLGSYVEIVIYRYVLNDVIQVFRGSEISRQLVKVPMESMIER